MGTYQSNYTGAQIDAAISKILNGGGNPRGTVISFMGTAAPEGYLICDGTTYNIVDYPDLATFFETQFGSKNFFGGNGTTTFKVPDLRNEFLRGYRGSAADQLSGNIGVHQDPTQHLALIPYSQKWYVNWATTDRRWKNPDKIINRARDGQCTISTSYSSAYVASSDDFYTSRPTNVAVLFCIKY